MKLKVAIELAVENGWRPIGLNVDGRAISWIKQAVSSRSKFIERYLLDPKFFQALGRGMGYKGKGNISLSSPSGSAFYRKEISWDQYAQHRLVDHLAEGKTIESYFQQLNPPKP